jgi:hypothetical protein
MECKRHVEGGENDRRATFAERRQLSPRVLGHSAESVLLMSTWCMTQRHSLIEIEHTGRHSSPHAVMIGCPPADPTPMIAVCTAQAGDRHQAAHDDSVGAEPALEPGLPLRCFANGRRFRILAAIPGYLGEVFRAAKVRVPIRRMPSALCRGPIRKRSKCRTMDTSARTAIRRWSTLSRHCSGKGLAQRAIRASTSRANSAADRHRPSSSDAEPSPAGAGPIAFPFSLASPRFERSSTRRFRLLAAAGG